MDKRKRFAFIRPKAWPLANRIVEGVLKEQFPDHEVDLIDIAALVRKRPGLILANSLVTLLLYGKDIALGRKKFRLAFWRTPLIFDRVGKMVRDKIKKGNYSFSFQMQSLFDASTPGVPHFVYTDHTHLENLNYTGNKSANLYSPQWIAIEREIYHKAAMTFVRSSNVQRSVIEDYECPAEKVALVFAGSNVSVSTAKTANTDYTQAAILFVGLDWRRKGGPDLIEAFKIVREKHPDATLTIVGANPEINIPNCNVVGKVTPQELDYYYQNASVFCLPTYLEPFGIAFIEAMTARLPIVATRVGAIPDFVEEGRNGWLVDPGDTQSIATALMKLIEKPEMCKSFGEFSFRLIQDHYSWDAVGRKFQSHILSKLEENKISIDEELTGRRKVADGSRSIQT